jgi:ATP-dependent helicase/nuclease subunit A
MLMTEDETGCGSGDAEEMTLTPQQQDALQLDRNIAITAGAGTGKTTTLKERYRHLLRSEPEIGPDQVLTLTFTNDATNEMRDRIREVIDEELHAATPGDYSRWRTAKDELEDAYLHTIHGFCSRILREFAVEASVHPEFETLDQDDAERRAEEAVNTVLDHYGIADGVPDEAGRLDAMDGTKTIDINPEWDLRAELRELIQLYSRSQLKSALVSLFDQRPDSVAWADTWADKTPEAYVAAVGELVETSFGPTEAGELITKPTVQNAIEELQQLADRDLSIPMDDNGMEILTNLVDFLEQTGAHTQDGKPIDRQRFLLAVATAVTTNAGTLQSQTWRYAGSKETWGDHGHRDARAKLKDALDTLTDVIDPEQRNLDHDPAVAHNGAQQAIALARVFQATRVEYQKMKAQQHALDYSDLITDAITFLQRDEQARQALRDQFEYIMIDEVQDTDPRQWQLVKLLSGDDPDQFDGQNVFLVGDEKQSIYRFRDADVTQFREARQTLIADNPAHVDGDLELTGNFRTVESTLMGINDIFKRVFQPAPPDEEDPDDTTTEYESYEAQPQWLDACRQAGTDINGTVEYLVVPDGEDADESFGLEHTWFTEDQFISRADREAQAVVERLTQLFAGETQVYDEALGACVSVQPRHVALLFRSSRRIAAFERKFEDEAIPYTNLAGSGFYDTPEILPLINLLNVFEEPTQDIPLYGVLRSPLFGFTDETLAMARDADGSLWESLQSATPELQSAREQIEEWRQTVGLMDDTTVCRWSSLLSQVIDDTGYLISIGAGDRPQQAVANVEKFREQLRNWEESSARSVTDLINRIERTREGGEDPSEATVPGEREGVELRTVHSAKGLEFPVVVIPEISRQFNMQSSIPSAHFERINDEPTLGMKAPTATNAYESTKTAAYKRVREHHRRRERAEQRRVLYVAATRARDHLLFTGTHAVDAETESGLDPCGEWREARGWQDWLQPILLDSEQLVSQLATNGSVKATIGDSGYTVRRPTPPADWSTQKDDQAVPTDIEIPAPKQSAPRKRLSATGFRDRLADSPDTPAILRVSESERDDSQTTVDTAAVGQLDSTTVGTVVHKLCELDSQQADWPTIIRRCVPEPDALTDDALAAIIEHAEAGLAGLRAIEAEHTIQSRHDELSVQLDLDTAQVVGEIDHLSVSPTGYIVVDYKTSDLEKQSIAELAEHYFPQLIAYAGALFQNDNTATQVDLALVFTDTGEVKQRSVTRDDNERLMNWASDQL